MITENYVTVLRLSDAVKRTQCFFTQ